MKCKCGFVFSSPGEYRNCEAFVLNGCSGVICPDCGQNYLHDESVNFNTTAYSPDFVMIDQYGQPVPSLSLISQEDTLYPEFQMSEKERQQYLDVNWYDVYISQKPDEPLNVYLMLPDQDINNPDEDYYITWDGIVSEELGGVIMEIVKVDNVLKRWSEEDGFYHI